MAPRNLDTPRLHRAAAAVPPGAHPRPGRLLAALATGCLALAGCAGTSPTCSLPGQTRYTAVQLFFGLTTREQPAPEFLSEAAWKAYEQEVLQPLFPDGFTVYAARGYWQDPRTGQVSREPTNVVLAMVKPASPELARRIESAVAGFKARVPLQQVVGVATSAACAGF